MMLGPLITIRFHNLHVDDIRGAVGELASLPQEGLSLFFFLVLKDCGFSLSLASPFCLPSTVPAIDLLLDFCDWVWDYYDIIQSMTTYGIVTTTEVQHFFVEYLFI